jgi:hypothetical protein
MKPQHDLKIAAFAGAAVELVVFLLAFAAQRKIEGEHFWLNLLQTPGGTVALRFFSHAGMVQAVACELLIQAVLFGVIALGMIYAFRILTGGVTLRSKNAKGVGL